MERNNKMPSPKNEKACLTQAFSFFESLSPATRR